MNAQRWSRIQEIFRVALERDPTQRAAFLREASGDDESLRAEVASLLEHHAAGSSFIERPFDLPIVPGAMAAMSELPAGARIGAYTIVRLIGSGGMGMVYAATQQNPRRTVALKVIRPDLVSPALVRRFEHEAQVLGRLQHPGIAQIYEAGLAHVQAAQVQVPYFAMELVEGCPLLECARANRLPVRARLELMVRICDAVQHAHQKGVIHRDLKPANILVTTVRSEPPTSQIRRGGQVGGDVHERQASSARATPRAGGRGSDVLPQSAIPKILDFGIARLTDVDHSAATLHTSAGQLVGTVPYMSPEQVSGDPDQVDTRSDVYALGVLSFELLTGRLPYDLAQKNLPEAFRIIGDCDPHPASSIDRTLRGDLETILAKALEKDKTRRYQSASELGRDIERFLRDQPISARPASAAYQLRKFARRKRAVVVGAFGVLVALVLGVSGTAWQAVRALSQRNRAVQAEQLAQRQLAAREIESAKLKAVNQYLVDMLKSGDPAAAPGHEMTVREMVDRAAEQIQAAFTQQPEVESALRTTLAQTYFALGRYREAEMQSRTAAELLPDSVDTGHLETLHAQNVRGICLMNLGELESAETLQEAVLDRCRRVLGPGHQLTHAAEANLGRTLQVRGRLAEAEPLLRSAMEWYSEALGSEQADTLLCKNNLAIVVQNQGKHAEAEGLYRELLAAQMRALAPDHPATLQTRANLSNALQNQGKLAEAETLLRETLAAEQRVLGDSHPDTMVSLNNLATILRDQGRWSEAEVPMRQALGALREAKGPTHPESLAAMSNLAGVLRAQGKLSEAEPLYRESYDLLQQTLGFEHWYTYNALSNLANCLVDLGQLEEAEHSFATALEGQRRLLGPSHPTTLTVLGNLARVLSWRNKPNEGEPLFREYMQLAQAAPTPRRDAIANVRTDFGGCLIDLQKYAEAETELQSALAELRQLRGEEHPATQKARRFLVRLYEAWEAAEPGTGKADQAAEFRAATVNPTTVPK